jgi:rhamnosyltransferase
VLQKRPKLKLLIKRILSRLRMDTYDRRKFVLTQSINIKNCSGLEIGPLDKPLVTKKDGLIKYLDYMSKEQLIARHASAVDPDNMVDIDYINSPTNTLSEAIQEKFDYIVACDVIEFIPNMIAWLNEVNKILKDGGYLYLTIPDKRYTFDIVRPATSLSHFLNDYQQNVKTADFDHVFEQIYLKRNITTADAWNNRVADKIDVKRFSAEEAYQRTLYEMEPGKYPDVHCHVFVSRDFLDIINMLIEMKLIDYTVHKFEDVSKPYNEFILVLKKPSHSMKQLPALLVTYNPAPGLEQHLNDLYREFDEIIIVDNGSTMEARDILAKQVQQRGNALKVIFNDQNLGMAAALNQGFSLAIELGYDQILTLDQDSMPEPGMKQSLLVGFHNHPNQKRLAVLAPVIFEKLTNHSATYLRSRNKLFFEHVHCRPGYLRNLTFAITSGSLYSLNLYRTIGPFREEFFIDAVDTEYCLRANQLGYEVSVVCSARLNHAMGSRQKKSILGRKNYPTFHSPIRWYYMSRNRIFMLGNYAVRFPHWFFFEMSITLTWLGRMIFFEDQRLNKLKAFFLGTADGLRKKSGKISPQTQKSIQGI